MRAVLGLAITACHVTSRTEITRPGKIEQIEHPEGAIARKPTLTLGDGGFRFVEPLECPTEEVVVEERAIEIETRPNLATFVIGVIATAAGGIMLVRGASADEPSGSPFTYGGAGSLAAGLPLAVGPWLGNGLDVRPGAGSSEPIRRPGPSVRCGERGLASASHATLALRGLEVFGRIDRDGAFAISPFQLVDAYDAASAPALNITGRIEAPAGARTFDVTIEGRALASAAPAFLARADFDAKVEAMRLVPNLVPGTLRVSLTTTRDGDAAARVVLAVDNRGPGAAYGLRGHLAAPSTPALDGRILYFGHVAKGAALSRELLIPLAPQAAEQLRNATVDLALELRDAHGTAPSTPVRFRGTILVDAPR